MICLTLSDSTLEECVKTTEKNSKWIDAVELRLDYLKNEDRERANLFPSMINFPVICTHRRVQDGGRFEGSEKQRKAESADHSLKNTSERYQNLLKRDVQI